jgi:SNF family Na+-dependent transporter
LINLATFPYIILTILVVRGLTLKGAGEGMNNYIVLFDTNKFLDPILWKDAVKIVQTFFFFFKDKKETN